MRRFQLTPQVALPLCALLLTACVQQIDVTPVRSAGFAPWSDDHPPHRLAPGDEIDVHFPLNPELNSRTTVAPEGQITAPLIGSVDAAGKTAAELQAVLRQRYAPLLRVPSLDVLTVGFGSSRVFVGGEVRTPGPVVLSGPTDVLQAVLMAGGALPTGRLSKVVVLRRRADGVPMLRTVDLKAMLGHGALAGDVQLRPNDVVYVLKTGVASFDLFVDQYLNQALPFQKGIYGNIGSNAQF